MIRTVIVDDDFMAVSIHRDFVNGMAGFQVVGTATSGREALDLVVRSQPDLLLLDVYLPDISGLEVLRRLRADGSAQVDVIAITSAKDVEILRNAMHLGVVHYIVKPFNFATFRERLDSYAVAHRRLELVDEVDQRDVDRLWGALHTGSSGALPKNISAPTLDLVATVVKRSDGGISASEIALQAGISQGIARRYLRYLTDRGAVDYALRYGAAGRPEHLYRWVVGAGPDRTSIRSRPIDP